MGSETVGALELEFESRIVQKLTISYAEHLTRGTVQKKSAGAISVLNTWRKKVRTHI